MGLFDLFKRKEKIVTLEQAIKEAAISDIPNKQKYKELFSYQTLSGINWASVVIDTETGKPHTAVYGEICIGGGRASDVVSVDGGIAFEEIYEYALRKQQNDFCAWFEPEKYKDITESNWREYL